MTPKQAKNFFNKVKGKKIRWTVWGEGEYFIPTTAIPSLRIKGWKHWIMLGNYFLPGYPKFIKEWPISNGFEPVFGKGGSHGQWLFVETNSMKFIKED